MMPQLQPTNWFSARWLLRRSGLAGWRSPRASLEGLTDAATLQRDMEEERPVPLGTSLPETTRIEYAQAATGLAMFPPRRDVVAPALIRVMAMWLVQAGTDPAGCRKSAAITATIACRAQLDGRRRSGSRWQQGSTEAVVSSRRARR